RARAGRGIRGASRSSPVIGHAEYMHNAGIRREGVWDEPFGGASGAVRRNCGRRRGGRARGERSEEHTSELQSRENLVCRLLLEKKKKKEPTITRRYRCDR